MLTAVSPRSFAYDFDREQRFKNKLVNGSALLERLTQTLRGP